ncbi:MAG: phage holin [Syntrophomonadaceae bacterium]|jgi:LL-H family phage holin
MDSILVDIGYQALGILLPALCAIAIELIRRKLGLEKMKKVQAELKTKQELASMAVQFVEQAYITLHGEEKYNCAAQWLAVRARERGIKVSEDEVKGLIEAALRKLKDEFGGQWPNKE